MVLRNGSKQCPAVDWNDNVDSCSACDKVTNKMCNERSDNRFPSPLTDSMGRHHRRARGRAQPRVRVATQSLVLPPRAQLVLHHTHRADRATLRAAAWLRIRVPCVWGKVPIELFLATSATTTFALLHYHYLFVFFFYSRLAAPCGFTCVDFWCYII